MPKRLDPLANVDPVVVVALKARYRNGYIAGAVIAVVAAAVYLRGVGLLLVVAAALGAGVGAAVLWIIDVLSAGQNGLKLGSDVRATKADVLAYGRSKLTRR